MIVCPKCHATSGDDWSQCDGRCPMEMSPHYLNPDWRRVIFSSDCDEEGNCPVCEIDYPDCPCPGPCEEEDYEYQEIDGVLHARRLDLRDHGRSEH